MNKQRAQLISDISSQLVAIDRDRVTDAIAGRELFCNPQREFRYRTYVIDGNDINIPVSQALPKLPLFSDALLQAVHGNKTALDLLNYSAVSFPTTDMIESYALDVIAYYSGTTTEQDVEAVAAAFEAVMDTRTAFGLSTLSKPSSDDSKAAILAVFRVASILREHEGSAWRYPRQNDEILIPPALRDLIVEHPDSTEVIADFIISYDSERYRCDAGRIREQLSSEATAIADGVL